jgi:carbamoyl-phosphate synthase large subunit
MTPPGAPKSVLIIGSGPVVIGQAAEFDYAGTQACRALRAEGIRTILVNSNPATIMTDPSVADAVYLEPLTVEVIERIIERERPEGLLAGLGGQTALNLAVALSDAGVFDRHPIRLLGTPLAAIRMAEDRELFRAMCDRIGQPVAPSAIIEGADQRVRDAAADAALAQIGLPAIVRPAFTLGGTGGGIVVTEEEYRERVRSGLRASPIGQVMVERCLVGWQEIEYEVMRDAEDTCIAVCSMENVDPLGVHTGDSIVVAPVQTLPDPVHQRLRTASLDIIRALGVEGGCNVQLALSPDYSEYVVIEVNPRVSRSSALASKATGYPIARVAAQIAIGRTLREIPNAITGTTVAAFEPALDYIVVKLPRFPFDKFPGADRLLGSQMKATGEVMAIDRSFGAALNKALRSMEQSGSGPTAEEPSWAGEIQQIIANNFTGLATFLRASDSRLWRLLAVLRRGVSADQVHQATGITRWFLAEFERLVAVEHRVREAGRSLIGPDPAAISLLATAKRSAFGDADLAAIAGIEEQRITARRSQLGLTPGYAMVDTCAAEFAAATPYFYSTFAAAGSPPEAPPVARPAALVIGSGPVRIGQGIEFDYCAVRAAERLRERGWSAVMVNSNPETVSTDFDASTRLYFEPLDAESIMEIIRAESPEGESTLPAFVQFGGQTPLNLAAHLAAAGVPLLGASLEAIDETEDRVRFSALLDRLGILQPEGGLARDRSDAHALVERIGYPVIVRPSYVIGGLAIDFAYTSDDLERQLARIGTIAPDRPLRIDRFIEGIEIDIDAISDGETVVIPGLLEHVELAGVHSGDSIAVYPPQRLTPERQAEVAEIFMRLVREIGVRGLVNAQFIVREEGVYLIEVNPRASRTVPFMSKVTGIPMVSLAVDIALGDTLAAHGYVSGVASPPIGVAVKAPAFSTAKLRGVDPTLGPFMQSTGEVIGIGANAEEALGKALIAASLLPPPPRDDRRTVLLSIADRDKHLLGRLVQPLLTAGYALAATPGTQRALSAIGIDAAPVQPLGARASDGAPEIATLIRSGEVALVVNTPSPQSGVMRDALEIRLAAVEEGVLCLTTMETAIAAAEALSVRKSLAGIAIGPIGVRGLRDTQGRA